MTLHFLSHGVRLSLVAAAAAAVLGLGLVGCQGGSDSGSLDTLTVSGDVPIAYAMRSTALRINPTDGTSSAPGGDLYIREKSSPSAQQMNITAGFTQGQGDVSRPEVSFDGKKIVFAMRCPSTNSATIGGVPACTGRWNIWEYDMTSASGFTGGSFRRLTSSTEDDDVTPTYLPAGRGFVFSSNRQEATKTVVDGQSIYAVDEYERERVINLHTMDADGGNIKQISVNQSHDRNPVVRPDGTIMFSRWEHVGPRNRFAVFTVKPDGTNMFVLYGAHSPGNSFLHPRDMDPAGQYKGFVTSSLMSLSGTQEGGSLMFIDAANYSEQGTPATRTVNPAGGQTEVTQQALNQGRGLSEFGRITSPYPLWDGTDRVLVAYRPCEVTRNGNVIPCANLTSAERARLTDATRTKAQIAADTVQNNAPAAYGIYMYDPVKQTFLIVAAPPPGMMVTDPVALQQRTEPNTPPAAGLDSTLAAAKVGVIEVRSVYDTDGLGRMSESVLAASDLPTGCTVGIAQTTAPTDPVETRSRVADIMKIKDPADPAYQCAPARFVRATRAVAPTANTGGMREAIGETDFEQQRILGYAPIEPDGSFKLQVPADTPLALSVIDAKGRALQTHLNWIQVRPGERRTCDGCHSPRRGAALNSTSVVNTIPDALEATGHQSGETLAALRTRLDASGLNLQADMIYTDVWVKAGSSGIARPPIEIRYTGNANPADDLATPAPVGGVINYPQHIAPIWTRSRGAIGALTCTNCHNNPAALDLQATVGGTGRVSSYEELVLGDPLLDGNGQPVTRLEDGIPMIERGPALVETMPGSAQGLARSSRLIEIMFGESLKADADARTAHPNPPGTAPDHSTMLNKAEKRLVTEWIDLGGQYFNDLSAGGARVTTLSQSVFRSSVQPILQSTCASCHQAGGNSGAAQPAGSFNRNRFVLTGSPEGDFNVTLSLVSDTCAPTSNYLLRSPSTIPHPAGATGQTAAVLQSNGTSYATIRNWIQAGCTP
jgi:hypothetical protein